MQLDLDQLVELVGLDKADILELIEMLLAQSTGQLDTIRTAVAVDGDLALARRAAHSLKGMSATLGFEDLAEAARAVERAARAGERDATADAVPALEKHVVEAWAAFRELDGSDS